MLVHSKRPSYSFIEKKLIKYNNMVIVLIKDVFIIDHRRNRKIKLYGTLKLFSKVVDPSSIEKTSLPLITKENCSKFNSISKSV